MKKEKNPIEKTEDKKIYIQKYKKKNVYLCHNWRHSGIKGTQKIRYVFCAIGEIEIAAYCSSKLN